MWRHKSDVDDLRGHEYHPRMMAPHSWCESSRENASLITQQRRDVYLIVRRIRIAVAQERKTCSCLSHSFETIFDLAKTLSTQQSHRSVKRRRQLDEEQATRHHHSVARTSFAMRKIDAPGLRNVWSTRTYVRMLAY